MAEICQLMGWDYYTFISQPNWFIDAIRSKRNLEAKFKQWQQKNN
jgi:hypothetical protein